MTLDDIRSLVIGGKVKRIGPAVCAILNDGVAPEDVIAAMTDAMYEVGEHFHSSNIYVPEMLVSAMAMKKGMQILRPFLVDDSEEKQESFIIGSVMGDLHDIGKNLVVFMLESLGFSVIDLGVDVAPETFVAALKKNPDCRFMGLSALLTTTLPALQQTVEAIKAAGLREQVYIFAGGAPLNESLARSLGADDYQVDAYSTAQKAAKLAGLRTIE